MDRVSEFEVRALPESKQVHRKNYMSKKVTNPHTWGHPDPKNTLVTSSKPTESFARVFLVGRLGRHKNGSLQGCQGTMVKKLFFLRTFENLVGSL